MTFSVDSIDCECAINAPVVKEIQGRKSDYLYNAEGAKISSVNVVNAFENIPNAIVRAQTVQDKMNEMKIMIEFKKELYKPESDDLLGKNYS